MQAFLLVGLGGALGAMGRYGVGIIIGKIWHAYFPLATILVNISGSFFMGLLIGLLAHFTPDWQAQARLFLAVGLFGGFTTFSAFSLDVVYMIERSMISQAVFYVIISTIFSILALFLGLWLVRIGVSS